MNNVEAVLGNPQLSTQRLLAQPSEPVVQHRALPQDVIHRNRLRSALHRLLPLQKNPRATIFEADRYRQAYVRFSGDVQPGDSGEIHTRVHDTANVYDRSLPQELQGKVQWPFLTETPRNFKIMPEVWSGESPPIRLAEVRSGEAELTMCYTGRVHIPIAPKKLSRMKPEALDAFFAALNKALQVVDAHSVRAEEMKYENTIQHIVNHAEETSAVNTPRDSQAMLSDLKKNNLQELADIAPHKAGIVNVLQKIDSRFAFSEKNLSSLRYFADGHSDLHPPKDTSTKPYLLRYYPPSRGTNLEFL